MTTATEETPKQMSTAGLFTTAAVAGVFGIVLTFAGVKVLTTNERTAEWEQQAVTGCVEKIVGQESLRPQIARQQGQYVAIPTQRKVADGIEVDRCVAEARSHDDALVRGIGGFFTIAGLGMMGLSIYGAVDTARRRRQEKLTGPTIA